MMKKLGEGIFDHYLPLALYAVVPESPLSPLSPLEKIVVTQISSILL
jgi:hypothetical protein